MPENDQSSGARSAEYPTTPLYYGPVHRKFRRFQLEYSDRPADFSSEETDPAPPRPEVSLPATPLRTSPSASTRLGLGVLAAGLALGALCQGLLDVGPPGLSLPLAMLGLLAAIVGLARWQRVPLAGEGRLLLGPALFFAAACAWRDSPTLKLCNVLALLAALALFARRARGGSLRLAGVGDYLFGGLVTSVQAAVGPFVLVFSDVRWREVSAQRGFGPWLAAGRGVLIALPLLFVFGGLFASADAVFEGLVTGLLRWSPADLVGHLFLLGFYGWLAAGLLRQAFLAAETSAGGAGPGGPRLGRIELRLVLGSLNLLFLAFVLVQIPYLFGGTATVLVAGGPTYAEYARRGFFELVTVTALALPLLLIAHWLSRGQPSQRLFNLLAGSLVGLLFVIVASALQRMSLYRQIYGETELRLYTTAFMLWLAVVFAWFLLTVPRGRRDRFAFGALVSSFAALAVLNALNPDALIVRANIGREFIADAPSGARYRPQPLDENYLLSLSGDAVPTLVELLPLLPPEKRAAAAARLAERWSPPARPDWRTWSLGRQEAWLAAGGAGQAAAAAP